jgi:hypothetical protein
MEKLLELFPDENVQLKQYRSFVNQPERIQISSQEDINDYDPTTLTSYFNFRVRLPRPALNVKTLQLARASIPNCISNIPDTECTFWYYALPTISSGNIYEDNAGVPGDLAYTFDTSGNVYNPGNVLVQGAAVYFDSGNFVIGINNYQFNLTTVKPGNVNVACIQNGDTDYWIRYTAPQRGDLRINYLRYIRLCPSYAQPELMNNFTGGFNRTFTDYDDLTTELNNATIDDPMDGEIPNEILGEFKFVPNQISFDYNTRFNKIVFTGLNTLFSYCPAASDDENWLIAAKELQERDIQNTRFDFTGAIKIVQPYAPFRDLNLRLGFNYATYPQGDNFLNMLRPIPPYITSPPSLQEFTSYDHVAPGYADLVYSSCCHIYCDITGGSTVDSILNKALLASIPLNTPNLGVGFHSLPLNNPLTKIVEQIYEIYIELRTDTGQPFYLGNNAIVSLEFILTY